MLVYINRDVRKALIRLLKTVGPDDKELLRVLVARLRRG